MSQEFLANLIISVAIAALFFVSEAHLRARRSRTRERERWMEVVITSLNDRPHPSTSVMAFMIDLIASKDVPQGHRAHVLATLLPHMTIEAVRGLRDCRSENKELRPICKDALALWARDPSSPAALDPNSPLHGLVLWTHHCIPRTQISDEMSHSQKDQSDRLWLALYNAAAQSATEAPT